MSTYIPPTPPTLVNPMPRIADVQCTRYVPTPGDRLIVRVYQRIDQESQRKLRKAVEKWSGGVAEVLIVD